MRKLLTSGAVAVGIPGFAALIYLSLQGFIPFLQKYQAQRIMGKIFHSSSEFTDLNRQQDNSMMAIGSGQLRGKGLFNNTLSSVKNGNFLSEEQTDFIFAVIGEELGFVGGVAVIALYAPLDCSAREGHSWTSDCIGHGGASGVPEFCQHCGSHGNLPEHGSSASFHKLRT